MTAQVEGLMKILYPLGLPPHLSDEEIAHQLDAQEKRRRAARKAAETRRQKESQSCGR